MEWVANIGGRFAVSHGGLYPCPHCYIEHDAVCWYWMGWFPVCSAGHHTTAEEVKELLEHLVSADA